MRVKCINNKGTGLPPEYVSKDEGYHKDSYFDGLSKDKEYEVYAIGFRGNQAWLYICDDCFVDSPRQYPECLFSTVNRSVSKSWVWSKFENNRDHDYLLAPPIWADTPKFFERLVDSDEDCVSQFLKAKEIIDAEAD